MRVSVPVLLSGIPAGVRNSGGVLDQVLREVEVECFPSDIPDHLDVDVSGLELYGAIHISDLPHSGSLKFTGDEHALVAHVTVVKEDATLDVAAPVAAEPEVAKKGKGDAAAPAADAKKK